MKNKEKNIVELKSVNCGIDVTTGEVVPQIMIPSDEPVWYWKQLTFIGEIDNPEFFKYLSDKDKLIIGNAGYGEFL